jgi:hypothetical protein
VDTVAEKQTKNRVAAEVYGAGNNTRHEDRKHAFTAEKSQKRLSRQKNLARPRYCLSEFFLMILVRRILHKRCSGRSLFFKRNCNLGRTETGQTRAGPQRASGVGRPRPALATEARARPQRASGVGRAGAFFFAIRSDT